MEIEHNGKGVLVRVGGRIVSGAAMHDGAWSWWSRDVRGASVRLPASTRDEAVSEAVAAGRRWGVE